MRQQTFFTTRSKSNVTTSKSTKSGFTTKKRRHADAVDSSPPVAFSTKQGFTTTKRRAPKSFTTKKKLSPPRESPEASKRRVITIDDDDAEPGRPRSVVLRRSNGVNVQVLLSEPQAGSHGEESASQSKQGLFGYSTSEKSEKSFVTRRKKTSSLPPTMRTAAVRRSAPVVLRRGGKTMPLERPVEPKQPIKKTITQQPKVDSVTNVTTTKKLRPTERSNGGLSEGTNDALFIRNLHKSVNAQHLLMGPFLDAGDIVSLEVHMNSEGQSTGTATVIFQSHSDAQSALDALTGSLFHGKQMRLSLIGASTPSMKMQSVVEEASPPPKPSPTRLQSQIVTTSPSKSNKTRSRSPVRMFRPRQRRVIETR